MYFSKCIFPKYMYFSKVRVFFEVCVFSKCTWLRHLLSFASLLNVRSVPGHWTTIVAPNHSKMTNPENTHTFLTIFRIYLHIFSELLQLRWGVEVSGICQHLLGLLTFQCHSQHYHSYYVLNGEALRHYIYLSRDAVGYIGNILVLPLTCKYKRQVNTCVWC